MLLVRFGLNVPDGLDSEGVRTIVELPGLGVVGTLGEMFSVEGASRRNVVGVRTLERIDGLDVAGPEELGCLCLLIEGCLWITDSLPDGAVNDRFGVEGADGAGRLMLGDGLRVGVRIIVELLRSTCILGWEPTLMRGLTERLGAIEGREKKPGLLSRGMLRCGSERGADWIDGLGAERDIDGADRLAWPPLPCEPRVLHWASATGASNSAAAKAMAPAIIRESNFFFIENIF